MPGPRVVSWWTRHPVNTSTVPSSRRTGTATSSTRRGVRSMPVDVGVELGQLGGLVEVVEDGLPGP